MPKVVWLLMFLPGCTIIYVEPGGTLSMTDDHMVNCFLASCAADGGTSTPTRQLSLQKPGATSEGLPPALEDGFNG